MSFPHPFRLRRVFTGSALAGALAGLAWLPLPAQAQGKPAAAGAGSANSSAAAAPLSSTQPRKMGYSRFKTTYGLSLNVERELIPKGLEQVLVYPEAVTLPSFNADDVAERENVRTIVFLKDVQVQGNFVQPEGDYGPTVALLGSLSAENVYVAGSWVYVFGDLNVRNLLVGDYNHGTLRVSGRTRAYMVVNSDHDMSYGSNGKQLDARYHLGSEQTNQPTRAEARTLFVPAVWQRIVKEADGDEYLFGVSVSRIFLPYLLKNQNPLARPDLAGTQAPVNKGAGKAAAAGK